MSLECNACTSLTPPEMTLKVAAVPFDIEWADVDANLEKATAVIDSIEPDTDIVVFPELFTSGFIVDSQLLAEVAESCAGRSMRWASEMASKNNFAIAGSFLSLHEGRYMNTGFFAEPSGKCTFYDKHHLFCLSPEAKLYGQGNTEVPVVNFRGWNVAMVICYDLRFPVWCRNDGQRYDIMLVPANWPTARGYAWHHLLVARAIENQTPWVGADRSGSDDYGDYNGLAEIVDAMGKPVAQPSQRNPSAPIYATFSKNTLERYRGKLPVGADADSFNVIPDTPLTPPRTLCPATCGSEEEQARHRH